MGSDEYSAAVGGGLKLKGVSRPAGVTKKKKKKNKDQSKSKEPSDSKAAALQDALAEQEEEREEGIDGEGMEGGAAAAEEERTSKTEAERRYEEMRRKRLDERLRKEGIKTHKQRVEELNKYLSTLSEHHDMPRIGPG